jgi:purine-binding chemotaxis protein CheW
VSLGAARTSTRALELRDSFDASFSQPPRTGGAELEDLLTIRVAEGSWALRLAEVAGIFADKAVTPLPSPVPALLGLAGFRAAIVPVYDLGTLLGRAGEGSPRWLVLTASAPVALAFDQFDGHLRVSREVTAVEQGSEPSPRRVREVVRTADLARPIVDIPAVLDAIKRQALTTPHAGSDDR